MAPHHRLLICLLIGAVASAACADGYTCATLSPDGKLVLAGVWGTNEAAIWEVDTGKRIASFVGHTADITAVAFSPDSKRFVTASRDKTALVRDVATGKILATLTGHADDLTAVAFCGKDAKQIVTASLDKTAVLWDVATGKKIRAFEGHKDQVNSLALSADGARLVTGSYDDTAIVWDTATGKPLKTYKADWVEGVAMTSDGKTIAVGRYSDVALWDAATGELVRTCTIPAARSPNGISVIVFTPDGKRLLARATQTGAVLFDAHTGKKLNAFWADKDGTESIAISADGSRVLIHRWETIQIHDMETKERLPEW